MNSITQHPGDDALQAFIDDRNAAPGVREHLEVCPRCREITRMLGRLDTGLRELPLERTASSFTEDVMARIGPGGSASTAFRILGSIVHLLGLFAVLAVMVAIFLYTGVLEVGQVQEGGTAVQKLMESSGGAVSGGLAAFSAFVRRALPFAFLGKSGVISLLMVIVVACLAAADRVLGRRFLAR
jgi:hypothetical protein